MWTDVQYSVPPSRSTTPTTTNTPCAAAASATTASSSPSSVTAAAAYCANRSRPCSVRLPNGAPNVRPFGYVPIIASGNTARRAPRPAASAMSPATFRAVAGESNGTGPDWTTATVVALMLHSFVTCGRLL